MLLVQVFKRITVVVSSFIVIITLADNVHVGFAVYWASFRTIYCYKDATLFEETNDHILLGRDFLPSLPQLLAIGEENSSFTCCDPAPHIILQFLFHMAVQ